MKVVMSSRNLDTYEINDSLAEDALWVNANVGEAMPDVITPLTWSIIRSLDDEATIFPGYYSWSGNICGRVYTNISHRVSAITTLRGWDARRGLNVLGDVFGRIPEDLDIPTHHDSRWGLVREMVPRGLRFFARYRKASGNMPRLLKDTPDWCERMAARIGGVETPEALLSLWKDEIGPYNSRAWWALLAGTGSVFMTAMGLNERIAKLVGTEDANALLANFRGSSELASLGPVVGIAKVARGEMSREEYLARYGHRGPHEFELSIPHPAEDPAWLERQVEEFKSANTDVDGLLREQRSRHEDARERLENRFPREAARFRKQLAKIGEQARVKEASRSEFTRVFRVVRAFALRAGELTGTGNGVFFLYMDELLRLLSGDESAARPIPARIETYNRYVALPPYPSIIRGHFDPFKWAADPNRRSDVFDATREVAPASGAVRGFPGAAGVVEGRARAIASVEEGEQLQAGEVLVTTVTNVGWTPLFPRAAAVVTDVGAPLSHAAIVARELGIPAVVGCGNATMRLRTGDLVRVDGGKGTVEVLQATGGRQGT